MAVPIRSLNPTRCQEERLRRFRRFGSLESRFEPCRVIETWRAEYNTERPHSSLGDLTPEEYASRCIAQRREALSLTADSSSEPN